MKKTLFRKFIDMEQEYVKQFSSVMEDEKAIRFTDDAIPDMYSHNFVYYKSDEGLLNFIKNELEKEETKAKGLFRIETSFPIGNEVITHLPIQPQVSLYDFMCIETKRYKELQGNPDCFILDANDAKVLQDGIDIDIKANQKDMGFEFATRRISRKAEVYKDPSKPIQLFVCYCEDKPIGNIEYMALNAIVKLEDFDIIQDFQRKGFGTSVLKCLLEKAYNNGIEFVYLIADHADTAKDMYKKCGFEHIGQKTELLFFLNS